MLSFFHRRANSSQANSHRAGADLSYEKLEVRNMLATFAVTNLNDTGPGSLRQAMLDANSAPGSDVISFSVAGTVQVAKSLPALTGEVDIDGTTAPGFAGAPVVAVDFNNTQGLRFNTGASGSEVQSLALIDAKGAGVKINGAGNVVVVGNFIGLNLDGATAVANRGNGLELVNASGATIGGETAAERNVISGNRGFGILLKGASENSVQGNYIGLNAAGSAAVGNGKAGIKVQNSIGNEIGNTNAVSSVDYFNAADGSDITQPVTAWQGIRGTSIAGEYMIVGTSNSDGLLYIGSLDGDSGTSYAVNYPDPNTDATSVYGPDDLGSGSMRLVGTYRLSTYQTDPTTVHGFLFEGSTSDLSTPGNYRTIDYPGAKFNYVHSTMGGLAVGNYDSAAAHGTYSPPLGPGHAYIYDIATDTFLTDIVFPGALSNTAYGIWHNGGTKYTIVGGYSLDPVNNLFDQDRPIGTAYMVDYDSSTGVFSNWSSFEYPNGDNFITHFEGISSVEKGIYTLNADSVQAGSSDPVQGSWVTVRRNSDGSLGEAQWFHLDYDGPGTTNTTTSSNSVYGNVVVGIVAGAGVSYQATIMESFQLSNVISGNGGDGILLQNADNNLVAMNFIGTDVTGTVDLGNAKSGIVITSGSEHNLIGGEETGGNNPTGFVFVRPPQGNLISGNNAYGVHIKGGSSDNQLSGNYIGTTASGNAALGNSQDGVFIDKANNNRLIGCLIDQDPFVFYNVISGNGGNGIRVKNSNDTTIHANFVGMGANNNSDVGNAQNGLVVEGTSTRTAVGGPIPLGNVIAANDENGIVVKGKASYFDSYNTFCGLAAFSTVPTFGNGKDGMLITSTGSNILIRTNVITENGDDGIEVSGKAKGVRLLGNIIGLDTNGLQAMGNTDNGIEVGGKASCIIIGGPQLSFNIIPQNTISKNGGHGVAITGKARDVQVNNGYIGLDIAGAVDLGNDGDGVYIGPGTRSNLIGSSDPALKTVISGNQGNGVRIDGSNSNVVRGNYIGTAADGIGQRGNGANGVYLSAEATDNFIGSEEGAPTNLIAYNIANGIFVESGDRNAFNQNSIYSNGQLGINLAPGANSDQTAPVLTSVQTVSSNLHIMGTLKSKARTNYLIEFFASTANGTNGQYYLGSQQVKTDAGGDAAFTFLGPLAPSGANFITVTATDLTRDNTSEFSNSVS